MKTIALGLALALALTSKIAVAQDDAGRPVSRPDIEVVVNGHMVDFADVAPVKEGGRLLVPLRSILKSLPGFALVWDPTDQTVAGAYLDRTVKLQMGSRTEKVNGRTVEMDVPATTIDGRTMVPLRFLSEALGAVVSWNNVDQRVTVALPNTTVPGSVATASNGPIVSARRPAPSRRFFRTAQAGRTQMGVQFNPTTQRAMTDPEIVAAMEQQLQLEYNQWSADRAKRMTDYTNYVVWSTYQMTYNTMFVFNTASSFNGRPQTSNVPLDPGGYAQWQAVLQQDAQQDMYDQQQFNADYAAYVDFFRRVSPKGTPIPRPSPL
jgi:hypothetical protein